MRTFVDTSALYALLDEGDVNHAAATSIFAGLKGSELVTHAYVFVETVALVSRRLGREAVAQLIDGVMTVISVSPVDSRLHQAAVQTYRNSGSSAVNFVDQTSFEFMRSNRLVEAFTFDSDYVSAGFELAS